MPDIPNVRKQQLPEDHLKFGLPSSVSGRMYLPCLCATNGYANIRMATAMIYSYQNRQGEKKLGRG